MKTWVVEAGCVAAFLLVIVFVTGGSIVEVTGALAVLFGFMHMQVADRMAEHMASREAPAVECYRRALYYTIVKELLWVAYFLLHHSYAALAGCVVFLAYPLWRRIYRKNEK